MSHVNDKSHENWREFLPKTDDYKNWHNPEVLPLSPTAFTFYIISCLKVQSLFGTTLNYLVSFLALDILSPYR